MTECERIIEQGILPESFFKEETICDFFVDKNRKKIWAVCIDLLIKFDRVCRSHNLRYSLAFGSLLGLVRHQGFIPWDDDIDIVMPRKDYEKLKEYQSEFKQPYFLQFPGEDEGYSFSFAKLRNTNTTGISWAFRYETYNQGQFIDIFPLDNYSLINLEDNIRKIGRLIDESSALMRRSCPFPDENDIKKMERFPIIRNPKVVVKELDNLLKINKNTDSDKYIVWCCPIYSSERMTFDKELFNDLIEASYYGYKVFIPRHYEKVLNITYGNYMELPPVEKRGQWHNSSIFNPDIPFKTTLNLLKEEDLKICLNKNS